MTKYCYACGKENSQSKYRLPNPNRLYLHDIFDKWILFINNPNFCKQSRKELYKKIYVCAKHFKADDFTISNNRKTLKYDVVPSIRIDDPPSNTCNEYIPSETVRDLQNFPDSSEDMKNLETENILEVAPEVLEGRTSTLSYYPEQSVSTTSTGKDKKYHSLRRNVIRMKKKNLKLKAELKQANNIITNYKFQRILKGMSTSAQTFFKCQLREEGRHTKGHRFTTEEKIFSLSLYKQGPKAYRHLRQIFSLPSVATIRNLLKRLPLKTGINDIMVEYLTKVTAGLNDGDRCCTIMFDEIFLRAGLKYDHIHKNIQGFEDFGSKSSKQIADHALVFMIRGLKSNWKFPFAYFFTESGMKTTDLVRTIKIVVSAVQSANLEVLALVCDQGSSNAPAINHLKQETKAICLREKLHYRDELKINNKIIHIIFDPPHLMKGLRNNLLNMDLAYTMNGKESIASWRHIEQVYEEDKDKDIKTLPKLCDYHIKKDKIKKMKVKYCTQVFSQRVASQMLVLAEYASEDIIDKKAKETAVLLAFFDKLFDSVNSSQYISPGKPMRSSISKTTEHVKFWKESSIVLKSMYFLKKNGNEIKKFVPPTLKNWIVTLQNIIQLWEALQNRGYRYFLTRRINQDPLENFFAAVRSLGKFNTRPTVVQFVSSFKTLLINNISTKHSINANCVEDDSYTIGNCMKLLLNRSEVCVSRSSISTEEAVEDFPDIELPPANLINNTKLAYLSGYILKKSLSIFKNCDSCERALIAEKPNVFHALIEKREFSKMRHLKYPTTGLMNMINDLKHVVMIDISHRCEDIPSLFQTLKNINIDFWECSKHKTQITKNIIANVCDIFVFKWCHTINLILQGKLRINESVETDPMKLYAFNKYKKHFQRQAAQK